MPATTNTLPADGMAPHAARAKATSKVPAAENTLRILKLLASKRGPMAASNIATALGLPRSSVYHLLGVMEANGFVLHLHEEQRYGLGISAFELSSAYSRQEPLSRLGRPLLASLVDAIGESAHLAVLHGRDVLYIVEERAKNRPSLVTDVGVRLPSHLTASGRAILAALPKSQVRALYPNAAAFTARHEVAGAIMKYSALSSHLDQVRQRGYATEHGEVTPGFGSIAVFRGVAALPDLVQVRGQRGVFHDGTLHLVPGGKGRGVRVQRADLRFGQRGEDGAAAGGEVAGEADADVGHQGRAVLGPLLDDVQHVAAVEHRQVCTFADDVHQ